MPATSGGRWTAVWQIAAAIIYFGLIGWILAIIAGLALLGFFIIDVLMTLAKASGLSKESGIGGFLWSLWRWNVAIIAWIASGDGPFPWTPDSA